MAPLVSGVKTVSGGILKTNTSLHHTVIDCVMPGNTCSIDSRTRLISAGRLVDIRDSHVYRNGRISYGSRFEIPELEHAKPCITGRFTKREANGLAGYDI